MKKLITLIVLSFFINYSLQAQSKFVDYKVTNDKVWLLKNDGTLSAYHKDNMSFIENIPTSYNIKLINIDKDSCLVAYDNKKEIKRYSEKSKSWEFITKTQDTLLAVLFNKKNEAFGISENGIRDLKTNKLYYTDQSLNDQRSLYTWRHMECQYIDRNGLIWLGFGYGEWGGNIIIFDTNTKRFLKPELDNFEIRLWEIKNFFEDHNNTYFAAGMWHLSYNGAIVKMYGLKTNVLFKNEYKREYVDNEGKTVKEEAQYISAADYYNGSFYIYSQNGFYKSKTNTNPSKFENWTFIVKPTKQKEEVYNTDKTYSKPMTVYRLTVLNKNQFIFLTENDGIGYYNGKDTTFFR